MKYKLKRPLPRASVGTIWDMLLGGKEILMKEDNNDLQELFPSATFSDWFEEVDERWKPERRNDYWIVSNYFESSQMCWDNNLVDAHWHEIGNCFRTRKLAEKAAEQIKALLEEFHKNNP